MRTRRFLFPAFGLLALFLAGAAPNQVKAPDGPTEVPFSSGERLVYVVKWDPPWYFFFLPSMEAGEVELQMAGEAELNGEKAIKILFKARSSGALASLAGVKVEDEFLFFSEPKTFCSLRVSKKIREGKRKRQIDVRYLRETHQLHIREMDESVTPPVLKKDEVKDEIPACVQDPFSAIYLMRISPLRVDYSRTFPIGNDDRVKEVTSRVEKQETIDTPAGKFAAWRINTVALMGGLFKEGGQFKIWFSADDRKIPVQFEANVSLGRAVGKLKSATRIPQIDRGASGELCAGARRKPNSVSLPGRDGNHSSGPRITPGIWRSTQKRRAGSPYPFRECFSI